MNKINLRRSRRAVSVLLAVFMTMTSLPRTDAYVRAAEPTETKQEEETVPSHDGTDGSNTVSENSVSGNSAWSEYSLDQEYLTDTLHYTVTDLSIQPSSYSAQMTAKLRGKNYPYRLYVLCTKDSDPADGFFPGQIGIAQSDFDGDAYPDYQIIYLPLNVRQDSDGDDVFYAVSGQFPQDSPLEPQTTYYYRLVCLEDSVYYFLTAPGQFTTGDPVETTSVTISEPVAETIGYNSARIVWTVENPNNEYIIEQYVYDAKTGFPVDDASEYWDATGVVPGKYYAQMYLEQPMTLLPTLYVYTGTGDRTAVSPKEPLTVAPKKIRDAAVTVTLEPGVASLRWQIQISPCYDMDYDYYWRMYYRKKGETSWNPPITERIDLSNGTTTISCDSLSPGSTYEYYMELSSNNRFSECYDFGCSETAPLTFTTKDLVTFDDSQFPDDALRNYIKQNIGLSAEEPITNEKLEKLTEISIRRASGDPQTVVRSLEGIQYAVNLRSLRLYNMVIADADMISSLTGLTWIDLSENELTSLPDLSGMTNLQTAYFDHNKIASGITEQKLPAEFLKANPSWLSDTARAQRIPAATPTQSEINAMYASLPWSMDVANTYAVNPSTTKPFAPGRLSDISLNNALNLMNFVRYTAGIPYHVTLDEHYTELTQAGALVNCVNNKMTHYPSQPNGFPDDLYQLGYEGCSSSNIAMGFSNLPDSIVRGWLNDGDSSNIDRVGHRRWVLDPSMSATGFGSVGAYSAMYVFDSYNLGYDTEISDFVAWPARNMPVELMSGSGYPWSVSLGTDYRIQDPSQVTVTMKNVSTGKTWTFRQSSSSFDGNYFSVNNAGYGQGTCIIFRPKTDDVSYKAGAQFEISILGLTDKLGNDKPLNYTVNLFSLSRSQTAGIKLNKTKLKMQPGDTETLKATLSGGNPDDTTVTWTSSNPGAATVDENGKVTAIAVGDTVVTAFYQGKTASCQVSVRDYSLSQTELSFDLAEDARPKTLTAGDGVDTVRDVTWSSSNESVASVAKSGADAIVTPKSSGTARILAQIKDGPLLVCTVTVANNALDSISMNLSECTLEKGGAKLLKLYYVPNDTTLPKEAVWTSDHPEVASVENGLVTALSRGTAKITAAVGGKQAYCDVTVIETAVPDADRIPSGLCALTNVQTRLSDISLEQYKGWEWASGDIPLARFSGMQAKSFAAVYHEEGFSDYRTTLNVSLATVTGISVAADQTALGPNTETNARILWKINGPEDIMDAYSDSIRWQSSDPSLVEILGKDGAAPGAEAVLKTGASTGKASITAQITLGAKTYKAVCKVTVTDSSAAVFENITAQGLTLISPEGADPVCFEGLTETQTGSLTVTAVNAPRLTAKSSSSKTVSVGKITSENGVYHIPLTLKAAGTARITLTAGDKAKTAREILLYVRDAKPNLSEQTIQVNKCAANGSLFYIYPNDGYAIEAYALEGADASLFEKLTPGSENDSYVIKAAKDTPKGSYRLTVKVTVSDGARAVGQSEEPHTYELPLTVKVTEQTPKYKVRQSAKANLFYRDLGAPLLTVTSGEKLTRIALTGCDFRLEAQTTEAGTLYAIVPGRDGITADSVNKKGTLELTFEGYETVSVPYTVAVENKKPKLSLDSKTVTFYPNAGILSAKLNVLSGGKPLDPDSFTAALRKGSGLQLQSGGGALTLLGGDQSSAAAIKEELEITCAHWTAPVTLPLTVRINMGMPALKLKTTSLRLNGDASFAAYDMAETEVTWKNAADFSPDTRLNISAVNEKSQKVINRGIVFEQRENRVIARLNSQEVAPGTYKFKVNVSDLSATPALLSVKVTRTSPDKAVKLSVKGNIDVLDREGSFVTVTPSLKSLNGEITDVKLTGTFAHLFRARLDGKNKILIYAKEGNGEDRDPALITGYPYGVNLTLTLTNAMGDTLQLTTAEIRIKPRQSRPRVTLTPKTASFFSGAYNSVTLHIQPVLKGGSAPEIVRVELMDQTDVFDYSDGVLTLSPSGAAPKGKTCRLRFKITFRGQADNEKALIVNYNVKIK